MGASMMSRTSRSSCMSARFNRWWNGSLVSVTLSTKVPRPCWTLRYPIAQLAAQRRTKIDLENMKRYIQERGEAAKSGDVGRCIAADINFHNSIARATHNEILSDLYLSMTVYLTSGYDYIYEDTTFL